jgi:LPPG:FO 2-phospho-L-lactate transferase
VDPADITVVVNTADDDRFHGLWVCPDLDTVTYTLAGAEHPEQGWGLAGETFNVMDALDRYGAATWFRLGDRDLATHLFRTRQLTAGATLTEATAEIAAAWGIPTRLLPMSDDRVATRVTVEREDGSTEELAMQEWFVRERTAPPVVSVHFAGADTARPGPGVLDAIATAETILVCPSNPIISIGPILAVPGVREALVARRDRVVGVSPIIGGAAVKGPADRMMDRLGMEVSCVGIAREYTSFCSTLVIDAGDAGRAHDVRACGMDVVVAETLMTDARVAAALARRTLDAVA